MKRRRIREIVAAAQTDYTGEPTSPSEITVTVRRPEDPAPGVGINVLWGVAAGTSKREAFVVALAAHGWEREWPALLPEQDRSRITRGESLDLLASPLRPEWSPVDLLWYLRERVTLP